MSLWPWAADPSQAAISLARSALLFVGATKRVYGSHGIRRALKAVILTAAVPVVLFGYRYAIVIITLYTTKLG